MAVAQRLRNTVVALTNTFPIVKRVVPMPARRVVWTALDRWAMRKLPDRRYMRDVIIPFVCASGAKRVLFVGCRAYTAHYPRLCAARNVQVWTIDIDPAAARWGATGRHVTGDASALDAIPICPEFDAIVFNGILGYGVDDAPGASRSFTCFARVLKSKALLVVGWNTDRTDDPRSLPEFGRYFSDLRDSAVTARQTFDGSTHVYDILLRNDVAVD
ncbi:MAG: hypothetical protein NVSMB19_23690 [Vulcanimicrobiaceae bacterium]